MADFVAPLQDLVDQFRRLPGIGGKAFNIAALPFGIKCIKGEGALAASAHSGETDQTILREGNIDPIEIVLPRAFDDDHKRLCVRTRS